MLDDAQVIKLLDKTGHIRRPFGSADSGPWPTEQLEVLTLEASAVEIAVASYQAMYSRELARISAHHTPGASASALINGHVDDVTRELMSKPRCECPDFALGEEPLLGTGNWKGCYGIGDFHCCVVKFMNAPPAFLAPHFDLVWARTVQAYAEIGLKLVTADEVNATFANIEVSFVTPDGSWIGLAIVGQGETCGTKIWAKFDKNYLSQADSSRIISEWTTLLKHEIGHNCGLGHSNGGVMNSYIVAGLPVSWLGDPSMPILKRLYGGVPVPGVGPVERELVTGWLYSDGKFEKIMTLPGPVTGPFPGDD
jgi:hypothetical protein